MYRIVKVRPSDNCTRDFLATFRAIIEYHDETGIVFAESLKTLDELWRCIGTHEFTITAKPRFFLVTEQVKSEPLYPGMGLSRRGQTVNIELDAATATELYHEWYPDAEIPKFTAGQVFNARQGNNLLLVTT